MDDDKFEDSISLLEKFNIPNSSCFHDNMIAIQKAKIFFNSGNDEDYKDAIDLLLKKENLTLRQKQIVEELFSYNQG